jgi:isohexenylglutaconyl-CoA hydratase
LNTAVPDTCLRTRREGAVLAMTLSRPRARNAIDEAMLAGLEHACREVAADRSIEVVLLRGEGPFFSAGGDLKERSRLIESGDRDALAARSRREGQLLASIERLPQIVLAVVEGGAVGLGLGIAVAADLVLAARPSIFGAPEVTVGAMPAQIAPFVVRRVGLGSARRLLMSGAMIDADEALRLGIVHELLADRPALDQAIEFRLAALRRNGRAVAATKRLIAAATRDDSCYVETAAASYVELLFGPCDGRSVSD